MHLNVTVNIGQPELYMFHYNKFNKCYTNEITNAILFFAYMSYLCKCCELLGNSISRKAKNKMINMST